jgi:hypothetical protein
MRPSYLFCGARKTQTDRPTMSHAICFKDKPADNVMNHVALTVT